MVRTGVDIYIFIYMLQHDPKQTRIANSKPSMECVSCENAQTRERASTLCKLYGKIWQKECIDAYY